MPYAKARDGTQLYYKDWGKGAPVVLLHGWPLTGDTFDDVALELAERGCRARVAATHAVLQLTDAQCGRTHKGTQ